MFLILSYQKIVFNFCETIFVLTIQKKDLNSERLIVLPPRDKFGSYSIPIPKYVALSEYLSIDKTLYPARHQIALCHYNPKKPHCYGLLWKSLNDDRFPYIYKLIPDVVKPQAGDRPHCIKATINYVKYLVQDTKKQQSIKGRTIFTQRLYTSTESAN